MCELSCISEMYSLIGPSQFIGLVPTVLLFHQELYSSTRYSLPRLSCSVHIYGGSLVLNLQAHSQARIEAQGEICASSRRVRAFAAIGPRITFTAGGSVSGNLLLSWKTSV